MFGACKQDVSTIWFCGVTSRFRRITIHTSADYVCKERVIIVYKAFFFQNAFPGVHEDREWRVEDIQDCV